MVTKSDYVDAKDASLDASVVILTYNGEQHIDEILASLTNQRFDGTYEILVIDSGSTDSTLDLIAKCPSVRLVQIPNSEFGHGKTRNLGAHLAKGRIVAYLTHDATPASDRWLHEITAPFAISDRIVAVMGAQIPRPDAFPLLRYEIKGVFNGFGPGFGTTLFYEDDFIQDEGVRNAVTFYSDVNSAARKDILTGEVPYRDVSYAEDQLLGRDVIAAGYIKALCTARRRPALQRDDRLRVRRPHVRGDPGPARGRHRRRHALDSDGRPHGHDGYPQGRPAPGPRPRGG